MATIQFGKSQAQKALYYYERVPYTLGPTTLNTGTTNVTASQNWNISGATFPEWQARFEWFEVSQNADVNLTWQADPQNTRGVQNVGTTTAARSGEQRQKLLIEGVQQLTLNLNNVSGSAINNFQFNYAVAMRRLLAADKIMRQQAGLSGYNLNKREIDAAVNLGYGAIGSSGTFNWTDKGIQELTLKGTLPISLERMLPAIMENRVTSLTQDMDAYQSSTADNPFRTYTAQLQGLSGGYFLVLTGIAIEGNPNVIVTVDRDDQPGYVQLNGSAFVQATDQMWDCWIPALSYLTFHVTNGPGNTATANIPIRLRLQTVTMSEVLAILFGRIQNVNEAQSSDVYYRTILGLL